MGPKLAAAAATPPSVKAGGSPKASGKNTASTPKSARKIGAKPRGAALKEATLTPQPDADSALLSATAALDVSDGFEPFAAGNRVDFPLFEVPASAFGTHATGGMVAEDAPAPAAAQPETPRSSMAARIAQERLRRSGVLESDRVDVGEASGLPCDDAAQQSSGSGSIRDSSSQRSKEGDVEARALAAETPGRASSPSKKKVSIASAGEKGKKKLKPKRSSRGMRAKSSVVTVSKGGAPSEGAGAEEHEFDFDFFEPSDPWVEDQDGGRRATDDWVQRQMQLTLSMQLSYGSNTDD